jgi:hypothetical protein
VVIFRDIKYKVDALKVQDKNIFIILFYTFNVSNFVFYIPEEDHVVGRNM